MSGEGVIGSLRRTRDISRLFVPFVGLQFYLLHDVLKEGPFCRSNHLKPKAKFPPRLHRTIAA